MPWHLLQTAMKQLSRAGRVDGSALSRWALSVPTLGEVMPDLRLELARARRHERPLSLLLVNMRNGERSRPHATPEGMEPSSRESRILVETRTPYLASLMVARILTGLLRPSDRVAYVTAQDRLVLVLPETNRDEAHKALARIEPVVRVRAIISLTAGIAAFPEDGYTLSDLMAAAEDRLWRQGNSGRAITRASDPGQAEEDPQ